MKKDYFVANEEFTERIRKKSKKSAHFSIWISEEGMHYHVCHASGVECDVPDDILSKKAQKHLKKNK